MSRPLILDNAIDRVSDMSKIFNYSYDKDLNVITSNNQEMAFIDIDTITEKQKGMFMNELLTKTEADRERDDDELCLAELETKTEAERESDDEGFSLIELQSKTFAERERDDEDNTYFN